MDRTLDNSLPWIITSFTLLLVLLSLKLLFFTSRAKQGARSAHGQNVQVVISGPMGNGKTHLWSRLIYGTDRIETVTSMVENRITLHFERQLVLDQKERQDSSDSPAVCLVDTPGHPRLSCRSLARNIPEARGIIFVIDSQLGLTGKGLRDTAAALELVLSFLQLLHYRDPDSKLPKLSIHLSNPTRAPTPSSSLSGDKSAIVQKTRATLTKELNRRKISSAGHSSTTGAGFRKSRLESLDAIPSSEFNSFFDLIKRLFKFNRSAADLTTGENNTGGLVQLPEEESEVTRLLEEEEDQVTADQKTASPLDRYERVSGHRLHWTISGQEVENEINLIKRWMIEL
ncbi:hypothetical protein PTTG_06175 [Puccinia triticina 1-1 BBBD Race 1]|uniref:Signal recognition particle receptor subunit beta n=2 Tax=Puccinia triticina TaxID=208348 RepID=A0A0C4EZB6_PUCT1|nr:uncharacterized protein PtA15_7A72 [Puccinia triticina]OAV90586.1 hypothetical protein PTTG_06175 [Puccinia triticina 1-1 BBBD Race 1]WAQ86346.1 hypothetical protein PtA15_7A72 [Puccinia triticina]WAR56225.1 hypothetical protein PtB15_7B70 [Puccinia triticina]